MFQNYLSDMPCIGLIFESYKVIDNFSLDEISTIQIFVYICVARTGFNLNGTDKFCYHLANNSLVPTIIVSDPYF